MVPWAWVTLIMYGEKLRTTFQNCPRPPFEDISDFRKSNPPTPLAAQPTSQRANPCQPSPASLLLKAKLKARQPRAKLVTYNVIDTQKAALTDPGTEIEH